MKPETEATVFQLGDGIAGQVLDGGIGENQLAVHAISEHDLAQAIGHETEPLFGVAQGLLGAPGAIGLTAAPNGL